MQYVGRMLTEDLPREADDVERELATLAAHLDAATHRMLALVRRFDELGAWAVAGARSCAHWLSWRLGLAPGAARERVRVALALGGLPRVDDLLRTGRLSYSKVRAMTRVATADNEEALCEMALCATAAQLERICRGLALVEAPSRTGAAPRGPERSVSVRPLESGLVRVTADLHPDEAALVMKAVEAARNVPAETSVAQRSAAVTSLASRADGLVQLAEAFLAGDSAQPRPAPERQQVVIELRAGALGDQGATRQLRAELEDGAHVPAETFRRVACDCALTAVMTDAGGDVVASGRRTRVVSAQLRRALRRRDPCCRFPGCTNRRWLDAHHVTHWVHRAGRARRPSKTLPPSAGRITGLSTRAGSRSCARATSSSSARRTDASSSPRPRRPSSAPTPSRRSSPRTLASRSTTRPRWRLGTAVRRTTAPASPRRRPISSEARPFDPAGWSCARGARQRRARAHVTNGRDRDSSSHSSDANPRSERGSVLASASGSVPESAEAAWRNRRPFGAQLASLAQPCPVSR